MPVHVAASGTGRVVVVSLVGDHDLASAEHIRRTLLDLSSHVSLVVLDFDATTFIDSSVLGIFVGAAKRAAREGNRVIGVNASGVVLRAMAMTGVDAVLSLPPTLGELEDELTAMLQAPPRTA